MSLKIKTLEASKTSSVFHLHNTAMRLSPGNISLKAVNGSVYTCHNTAMRRSPGNTRIVNAVMNKLGGHNTAMRRSPGNLKLVKLEKSVMKSQYRYAAFSW